MTTRILLWSPLGAGEHYYGPGAFAHRLYSSASPGSVNIELMHSSPAQAPSNLFAHSHRLEPQPDTPLRMARYLWRSKQWLQRNVARFDVFHGLNGFHPTVAPAFIAQQLGLPSVIFVAGHKIEFTDKPGLRALAGLARRRRHMAGQLSALIAMSRAIHQELLEFGVEPRRIACIPMGIDMRRFSPASDLGLKRLRGQQLGLLPDLPTLIFVGAVTPRKRPHLIVEALGLLRRQGLDVQLVLAGPTPQTDYSDQIKTRATQLQVASRVHWVGHLTAIEQALQASDVFLLPSSSEGMPAALVEAMACGLPAIVTRISGCEDLITDDRNGYFVAADSAEIAACIRRYALDATLCARHGERARRDIESTCSNETVLSAYLQVFDAVRQGRDPESASTLRY
jgi:glycosyltransferase involved in cell wall biosynthesis